MAPLYKPNPGDIGLTQISDWGGRAIRIGQWLNGDGWENYQHAFMVTKKASLYQAETIIEAMPGGAQVVTNWHNPQTTFWLRCPANLRDAVADAALQYEGVPYGWLDYSALALHRFHIPAPHLRNFIEDSGSMICSQLVDRAARDGGWHLFDDGRWEGYVTPLDLYAAGARS